MEAIFEKKILGEISGSKNEDAELCTAYFRKYYSSLKFYASRFLDDQQSEDVVQDAFMDLWQRRDKINKGEYLRAFLYKSVYTRALNIMQHTIIVETHGKAIADIYIKKANYFSSDNNEILDAIESNELGEEILQVIESLPGKCKEVFKLSYLYEMKNKEIAEVMGVSLRTVEAHMYKALGLLRVKLKHLITIILLIAVKNIILY